MPSEDGSQRLHPSSLLFSVVASARSWLVPGILVLIASRGDAWGLFAVFAFLPATVFAMIHYFNYRYLLGEDEIIIRAGIITRNERHILYTRVQNINLKQNPLHRLLGVAEVQIETASGDKAEATMRVLSLDAVEHMRDHVYRERARRGSQPPGDGETTEAAEGAAAEQGDELVSLSLRDLVLLGLITNRGLVVLAMVFGLFWQFDELWSGYADRIEEVDAVPLPAAGPLATALFAVVVIVGALILLRVLSMGLAIVLFYGFRLRRTGQDLRTEYGLFTRITNNIPRHRIQLLSERTNPLHRWTRRIGVQVETAGGGARDDDSPTHRLWVAPLLRLERRGEFLQSVMPVARGDGLAWRSLAPGATGRLFRRWLVISLLVATPPAIFLHPAAGLIAVPMIAWAGFSAHQWVRHAAWAVSDEAVFYRSGWWVRRLSVVPFDKIQTVIRLQSPFDRRHRMASVRVDTAGAGRVGHRIDIDLMTDAAAADLARTLSQAAGETRFHW